MRFLVLEFCKNVIVELIMNIEYLFDYNKGYNWLFGFLKLSSKSNVWEIIRNGKLNFIELYVNRYLKIGWMLDCMSVV